jgi:hypothetical protein
MGIDIGDLSSVMLANVPRSPASYVQRVGRAGRATGNSLITTFVGTDTHGLYYLSSPEAMIAGEVRPPDCYLDAIDTLKRQYVAFLIDRIADLSLEGPPIDRRMAATMKDAMSPAGLFGRLIAASTGDQAHIDTFLGLFGSRLTDDTVERLREFAERRHRNPPQERCRDVAPRGTRTRQPPDAPVQRHREARHQVPPQPLRGGGPVPPPRRAAGSHRRPAAPARRLLAVRPGAPRRAPQLHTARRQHHARSDHVVA